MKIKKENLKDIINAIPMLVVVVDKEGEIFLANDIVQEFAQKKEELEGQRSGTVFGCEFKDRHPSGCGFSDKCKGCQLRNTIRKTIQDGETRKMIEIPFWFKDKGLKDIRITTKLIKIAGEKKVLLSIEDLEIQKYESKLEEYKATKETIDYVFKKINSPLQIVLGYIQLIEMRKDNKENFGKIVDSIEEMKKILQELAKK